MSGEEYLWSRRHRPIIKRQINVQAASPLSEPTGKASCENSQADRSTNMKKKKVFSKRDNSIDGIPSQPRITDNCVNRSLQSREAISTSATSKTVAPSSRSGTSLARPASFLQMPR